MLFLDAWPRISLYFPFVVLFTQLKIILTKEKKEILFLETCEFFWGVEMDASFYAQRVYSLYTILWCKRSFKKTLLGCF